MVYANDAAALTDMGKSVDADHNAILGSIDSVKGDTTAPSALLTAGYNTSLKVNHTTVLGSIAKTMNEIQQAASRILAQR